MTDARAASDTTVHIVRTFPATPDRVFKAFTDPHRLRQWFCPEGFVFDEIRVDPESGLATYFNMRDTASGDRYVFELNITTVDSPNKIVWTSTWREGFPEPGRKTGCTINFRSVRGGTEVTIINDGYIDRANRDDHAQGWGGGLDKLEKLLAAESD